MIQQFRGEYRFLSNFYPSKIEYGGIVYPTLEHFFQAMKTLDKKERLFIAQLPYPGQAKKAGRKVRLRPDWENIKLQVMAYGLSKKFKDPILREKLIGTTGKTLVEGNYWNDTYWGICLKTGKGQNHLGNMLMQLRDALVSQYH